VRNSCQKTPPTNAPAALGALVASLAALRVLSPCDERGGATIELVASGTRMFRTTLPRNDACRFDHRRLGRIETLQEFDSDQTIGSFFDYLQCQEIELFDFRWDRKFRCAACAHEFESLRVKRALPPEPCPSCWENAEPLGFHAVPSIRKSSLPEAALRRSLRELGLQCGDIVVPDFTPQAIQLGDPFRPAAAAPALALAP
jgi:hypothetical protein